MASTKNTFIQIFMKKISAFISDQRNLYSYIFYGKEEQLDGSSFETGYFIDIKWNRNVVYILTIGDLNELNVPRNHTSSSYSVIHKLLPSNVLEILINADIFFIKIWINVFFVDAILIFEYTFLLTYRYIF
jgi:hypothetical protein